MAFSIIFTPVWARFTWFDLYLFIDDWFNQHLRPFSNLLYTAHTVDAKHPAPMVNILFFCQGFSTITNSKPKIFSILIVIFQTSPVRSPGGHVDQGAQGAGNGDFRTVVDVKENWTPNMAPLPQKNAFAGWWSYPP